MLCHDEKTAQEELLLWYNKPSACKEILNLLNLLSILNLCF